MGSTSLSSSSLGLPKEKRFRTTSRRWDGSAESSPSSSFQPSQSTNTSGGTGRAKTSVGPCSNPLSGGAPWLEQPSLNNPSGLEQAHIDCVCPPIFMLNFVLDYNACNVLKRQCVTRDRHFWTTSRC